MTAEIIDLPVITCLDLQPERVLRAALESGNLRGVVVLGWTEDGEEYMASSIADGAEVVWLMERCKHKLLSAMEDD